MLIAGLDVRRQVEISTVNRSLRASNAKELGQRLQQCRLARRVWTDNRSQISGAERQP